MQEINGIDSVLFGILFLSTLLGFWRGLFASFFGILTLLAAAIAAFKGSGFLVPGMDVFFGDSPLTPLVAGAFVFLIVFLLTGLVSKFFVVMLKKADMSGLNRLGGATFGVVRGAVLMLAVVLLLSAVGVPQTQVWKESQLVPLAGALLDKLLRVPVLADYSSWIHLDRQQRPLLVDGRPAAAAKKSSAPRRGDKKASPVLTIDDVHTETKVQGHYNKLESVLETSADHVNVKSPYAPEGEKVRVVPESTGNKILCTLVGGKDCPPTESGRDE